MNNKIKLLASILGCYLAGPSLAGVSVTIYNDNFGVVRETRELSFDAGVNTIRFTDVASEIDPTSVSFKSLDLPGDIRVLEQNYEYDLVSADSLLSRYVDKEVLVTVKGSGSTSNALVKGVLSAYVGGDLIVKQGDGSVRIIGRGMVESIELASAPGDLVTRPTLVWLASASSSGTSNCEVTYTTGAIGWKADYTVVLNGDDTSLDFSGWVTINNYSGAGYEDARIKLIAGDVNRVQEIAPRGIRAMAAKGMMEDLSVDMGFEEKSFMEYHMYTLGRPSTIGNKQTKQIEFIEPVSGVKAEKEYVYEAGREYYGNNRKGKVQIKVNFENKETEGLGIALPKGKVRTFKADPADGSLEFVGEDMIEHTAREEEISLYIGNAFDIVVEEVVKDQRNGDSFRTITREVKVKNRKEEKVKVNIDQYVSRYSNWEVSLCELEGRSLRYNKLSADKFRMEVQVGAGEEVKLEYSYTESWR
ncbi:MAG: DUF4139 domain-containing protein [Sedimentisphaerales bacterium]|nr:DUF4139 domain-containing protein [Sedimentisphaerales bacterium]